MKYELITVGSLMTDILAADLPRISEPTSVTYAETDFRERIGGHPIDACIDLVKIGFNPKKLAVIGVVGGEKDDTFAKFILDTIKSYKITTKFIKKIPGRMTGKNIILEVKKEDRRFHISPGANQKLDPSYIMEVLEKYKPKIFSARPCYTGMDFHMEQIFKTAGEQTVKMIDICKPYKAKWKDIMPALKYVDIFHGNDKEVKSMTGKNNLEDAIKVVLDYGVKAVFITKGDKGNATLITEKMEISQPSFDAKPYVKKGEAIDGTGCGDAFCAGIIYKVLEYDLGMNFINCEEKLVDIMMFAQAVGASAATKIGCTEGVSRQTLNSLLNEQGNNVLNKTKIKYNQ